MAKKKTAVKTDAIDYSKTENLVELYLAKAIGENVALPETDDTRLLVYLRKLIEVIESSGGGTEVIANPTLAGTEADLTGLQVGETKYKVPSVPHLYLNQIRLAYDNSGSDGGDIRISFYSNQPISTTMTFTEVLSLLSSFSTEELRSLICQGVCYYIDSNTYIYTRQYDITGVFTTAMTIQYVTITGASRQATITNPTVILYAKDMTI